MLEWYEAYADYEDVARRCEALVAYVAEAVGYDGEIDFSPPWRRETLAGAIGAARRASTSSPTATLESLQRRDARAGPRGARDEETWAPARRPPAVEVRRAELIQPTFLHRLPRRALAVRQAPPRRATGLIERFEAFADGMEFANAFTELNDPDDQRARFEEQRRHAAAGDEEAQPFDEAYLARARARHAADRRDRHRHRPPGDAADRAAHASARSCCSRRCE